MEPVFNCRKNQTNSFYRNANKILPNGFCLPRIRMGGDRVVSENAIWTNCLEKVQDLPKDKWISRMFGRLA